MRRLPLWQAASLALSLVLAPSLFAQGKEIVITIDDVPRGGDLRAGRDLASVKEMTTRLLRPLRGLPVVGYVNAGRLPELGEEGLQEILRMWVKNGNDLGNHTNTHPSLNNTPLKAYLADIEAGEPAITKALGHKSKSFRHPFLQAGKDIDTKLGLQAFLHREGYKLAPVTIDNSDYLFAFVYAQALQDDPELAKRVKEAYVPYLESVLVFFEERTLEVVGRPIPQILLLHANQLNAEMMPQVLAMLRKRGYRIVSLERALRDPAYQMPEEYVGPGGFSWIHRWSMTKKLPNKGEPEEPAWLREAYQARQTAGPR